MSNFFKKDKNLGAANVIPESPKDRTKSFEVEVEQFDNINVIKLNNNFGEKSNNNELTDSNNNNDTLDVDGRNT